MNTFRADDNVYANDNMQYNNTNIMPYYITGNMQYCNTGNCPLKLAAAYVPFQYLYCIYPPMTGLKKGTIFPELDRPYGVDPEYTVDA